MIAKRIECNNASKSRFSKLVAYITNAQGKNERVGVVRITNCQSEHPTLAAKEVESVQSRNTRTKMDKTYHMLVSFRAGEQPSADILKSIEDRLCSGLGYQEHQRISAVHYDTDHLHIHIAINKVHPVRLTVHQPYRDYKICAELCVTLEREYGLDMDNHTARLTPGEAKAQDMEKTAGIESLIGWIKRGCFPELRAAASWGELHRALAQNGLKLEPRGRGLVIKNSQGIATKASSLERSFSMNKLQKKLGVFEPAPSQEVRVAARYEIKPMASRIDTRPLWALYQHERLQHTQRHTVLRERAKHRKNRRIEAAKKTANMKRASINPVKGRMAKAMLLHTISDSLMKEIRAIQQDYQEDRRKLYEKGKHIAWYDWLKAKAWEGNVQALEVLRHRYDRAQVRVNTITGEGIDRVNYLAGAKIETVTKRGTIHYQIAQTVLRDDGKVFRLSENASEEVVATALNMAIQRFGRKLAITGTEAFRNQAVAAGAKLNIVFTDPDMEKQRLALIANHTNTTQSAEDVASRYIAERNDKRHNGIDIMPHRRYAEGDAGQWPFSGLRQIEGQHLMLLQTPTEMLVLPIDGNIARRAQRLTIGNMIDVTAQGILRARARRM